MKQLYTTHLKSFYNSSCYEREPLDLICGFFVNLPSHHLYSLTHFCMFTEIKL